MKLKKFQVTEEARYLVNRWWGYTLLVLIAMLLGLIDKILT